MPESEYIPAREVRRRYGDRSEMWIARRLRDDSGFPKPIKLNGDRFARRYWRVSELETWERQRAAASEAA